MSLAAFLELGENTPASIVFHFSFILSTFFLKTGNKNMYLFVIINL